MGTGNSDRYGTYPVASAAYVRGDDRRSYLTHVVDRDADRVLCRRVNSANVMQDDLWGGDGCTDRTATCPTCRARDPRGVSP